MQEFDTAYAELMVLLLFFEQQRSPTISCICISIFEQYTSVRDGSRELPYTEQNTTFKCSDCAEGFALAVTT